MPLDSYSPCPGGRDKKIRFCCPDLLKDLQQLETSLANGQFAGVLAMIETLEKDHPNCACLASAKCLALRESGRFEEFLAAAESFRGAEPDNPRAIAEYAIGRAISGDTPAALSALIDGIEKNEPGKIDGALLLPLAIVAPQLLERGRVYAAVALAKLVQSFSPKSLETAALLGQIYRRKDIPLIEKELSFDPAAPEDFPFRDKYADAAVRLATGHWKKGKTLLEELLSCAGQWPNLYRSLGLVNFWLGDDAAAADAMKKFAASDRVAFDDAVDAETAAMMARRQLSDDLEVIQVVRTIVDPDKAIETLLSTPRIISMPFDPRRFGSAERPAPSHVFRVVDRPFPEPGRTPTIENTPVPLGTFLFFGKQTDRDARIEIQVLDPNREALLSFLTEILGENLGSEIETTLLTKVPWLFTRLDPEFQIKETPGPSAEDLEKLYRDYFERVFIDEWIAHPSDFLDGETPAAYAKKPESARVLAGLIQMVAFQTDPQFSEELARALRDKLGVPQPDPIIPPEGDDTTVLTFFQRIPIWRWNRIDVSKLSVSAAGQLLRVASLFGEDEAMTRLSDRILSLPADKENAEARFMAYQVKIAKAESTGDAARALELIAEGKKVAQEAGLSDATLNLREAALQLAMGRPDEFQRTITHVITAHRNEPEAMTELQMLMVSLGLVNPDGTPRTMGASAAAPAEPADTPNLWTPDTAAPSGGGSKLWTPD
ncbi:MAG: hypothetical protein ACOX6D_03740 [Thermoguttaceae bacterium]|jgi:hypothetical protein